MDRGTLGMQSVRMETWATRMRKFEAIPTGSIVIARQPRLLSNTVSILTKKISFAQGMRVVFRKTEVDALNEQLVTPVLGWPKCPT